MKKEKTRKELREQFGIKEIGGGLWGSGFYDCLKAIDRKNIELFKQDFVIKRILFAQKNKLPYEWLLNQLNHDWKKGIGLQKIKKNDI